MTHHRSNLKLIKSYQSKIKRLNKDLKVSLDEILRLKDELQKQRACGFKEK
jgi:hypothetical protein